MVGRQVASGGTLLAEQLQQVGAGELARASKSDGEELSWARESAIIACLPSELGGGGGGASGDARVS